MRVHTRLNIEVTYSAPIFRGRRVLRVLPLELPNQQLKMLRWRAFPASDFHLEKTDENGNRRLFLHHQKIESLFHFELEFEANTNNSPLLDLDAKLGKWKMPSRAVSFTEELQSIAHELKSLPLAERIEKMGALCYERLHYTPINTPKPAKAIEIWERKSGTCADFSHLFIALCRMSGLPARYVAGYAVGEGQMHAWSEFWHDGTWTGFDATHNRYVSQSYVSVARGRDFYDCAPHEGNFFGDGKGELKLFCRTITLPD